MNPEKYHGPFFAPDHQMASKAIEPSPNLSDSVLQTVRDGQLRNLLLDLIQRGRVEQLCAMSAVLAADEIGMNIFGMTTRKAALLYGFVVANKLPIFTIEIQGRRKIPHFTPPGLLVYVGLASEDAKGVRRGKLFPRAKAALGNELGRQLHEIARDNGQREGKDCLREVRMHLTGEFQAEHSHPSYLREIPEFTPGQLATLAQTTPKQFWDWLQTIPGTNFDTVTIPPDIFPAASTVLLLVAADMCVQTGTYSALKEFDPSLAEVNKQELRYGARLADIRFFRNHPERRDFEQLYITLRRWFNERAVQQIEWREE